MYNYTLYVVLLISFVNGLMWSLPDGRLLDFGSFWASGEAAVLGLNPYGVYEHTFKIHTPTFDLENPNLNPPASLLFFGPISYVNPYLGFFLIWASSFLVYFFSIIFLYKNYEKSLNLWTLFWALSLPAFWDTLHLGQIYAWLALLSISGWILIEKNKDFFAAICVGILIAFKPNFLVWPVLYFLVGRKTFSLLSITIAASLQLISGYIYGFEVFDQWVQLVISDTDRRSFPTNLSFAGFFQRLNLNNFFVLTAPILALIFSALVVLKYKPKSNYVSGIALIIGILASPLGWIHYMLIAVPVFFVLRRSFILDIAMLLILIPPTFIISLDAENFLTKATIGSSYSWSALILIFLLFFRCKNEKNIK